MVEIATRPRRVGDKETITYIWRWRECEICGNPAAFRISFLLEHFRTNPASRGYGRDDCSWCSDEDHYGCRKHHEQIRRNPPYGMTAGSEFTLAKFKHMGFYQENGSKGE